MRPALRRLLLKPVYPSSRRTLARHSLGSRCLFSNKSNNPSTDHDTTLNQKSLDKASKRPAYSDEFCARLFATTAFGVDFILQGMQMIGVDEVGPLALRELAIREENCDSVSNRLAQLSYVG